MTNIRAIIIDPFKQEVREVEDDFNDFKVIQQYLYYGRLANPDELPEGYPFCLGPRIDSIHHMYVDDEGLFRQNQKYFEIDGYPQALAGYGVILAMGEGGNERSATLKIEDISRFVSWQESEAAARATVQPTRIYSLGKDLTTPGELLQEIPVSFPEWSKPE